MLRLNAIGGDSTLVGSLSTEEKIVIKNEGEFCFSCFYGDAVISAAENWTTSSLRITIANFVFLGSFFLDSILGK